MQPKDDSINLSSELTTSFIKVMFNKYTEHHKDDNSLNTYQFITLRLLKIPDFVAYLPFVKNLSSEFQFYTNSQLTDVVINSLVKKNLLVENQARNYYLTPTGYRLGLKKTNIIKFWSKYYPHVLYPTTGIFITAILGSLLTS